MPVLTLSCAYVDMHRCATVRVVAVYVSNDGNDVIRKTAHTCRKRKKKTHFTERWNVCVPWRCYMAHKCSRAVVSLSVYVRRCVYILSYDLYLLYHRVYSAFSVCANEFRFFFFFILVSFILCIGKNRCTCAICACFDKKFSQFL